PDRRRDQEARSGCDRADALQRREFHPDGARTDAGQASGADHRRARDLRRVRHIVLAAAFVGGVVAAVAGWLTWPHQAPETPQRSSAELMDVVMWGKEPIGGPFRLVDHTGATRTEADFLGKLLLIYFGFTYCSDACPIDLQSIGQALDHLGPLADAVQPLFI